jgi:choline dehydrogenase-like flavoprotein
MPDYVIVGGGSAGCVLAARLSERADLKVELIEAGPPDDNRYIHIPAGFYKVADGPLTWGYQTLAARGLEGRVMTYPQGRVLGGGSSINAQVFTRGRPQDYDDWADKHLCAGWSFKDVLPYFLRSEDNDTFCGPRHGVGGPLAASFVAPHPLSRVFVQAAQQAGLPFTADFNAGEQQGCGFYQTTTRHGRRCSAAVGYLKPAMTRPNLRVRTDVLVTRILFEGHRAIGVEIASQGKMETIRADREVIICAGAIGSP